MKIFAKEDPKVIFDIGACDGIDSVRYSRLFNDSTVYSFEPLLHNHHQCLENFAKYSNGKIKPYQLALSDKNGFSTFFVSSGNPDGVNTAEWDFGNKSSSLYPPDPAYKKNEWLAFNEQIEVKTQTIASFCKEHAIGKIDFIHLDVQGAELDVLKGAGAFLNNVSGIWLEVENVSMYKGQPLKKDIEIFMKKANFFKAKDLAFDDYGDQLYLNASLYSRFSWFVIKNITISRLIHFYTAIIPKKLRRILHLKKRLRAA
ncbi:MAG: FkbM family methyltransferase [Bacteroidetes bacterium]|nr:FkbM family methyltransferase [Bacteroidota bacterium]